jgi:hypothetical protein
LSELRAPMPSSTASANSSCRGRPNLTRVGQRHLTSDLLKQRNDLGRHDLGERTGSQRRNDVLGHVTSVAVDAVSRVDELAEPPAGVLPHRESSCCPCSNNPATGHDHPLGGLSFRQERRRALLPVDHQSCAVATGRETIHTHRDLHPQASTETLRTVHHLSRLGMTPLWKASRARTRKREIRPPRRC